MPHIISENKNNKTSKKKKYEFNKESIKKEREVQDNV
jgi:hypothetical protein